QATGVNNQGVHILERGDEGADVAAVQYLLTAHGVTTEVDGDFGPATDSSVRTFQSSRGLVADGVVGPATWSALMMTVRPATANNASAVRAVQHQLSQKVDSSLAVTGTYDAATQAAVRAFQADHGLTQDAIVGPGTWGALLGHFAAPRTTYNCFYGTEAGNTESWGTAAAVSALTRASRAVYGSYGRVAVGDLSHIHGGDIAGHASHEVGLDADLRLITTSRDQCSSPTNYQDADYDRAATRALIQQLRATGQVKLILFNDPVLVNEGLVQYYANHDDHLHVRFYERGVSSTYSR
ncbi:MAG TPA: penicillin-insensitive murein endopeptidase, partial [Nocardioides sp.]|nr:penicillin-insensitive murein endopeptidase [Nocardioides sp.]